MFAFETFRGHFANTFSISSIAFVVINLFFSYCSVSRSPGRPTTGGGECNGLIVLTIRLTVSRPTGHYMNRAVAASGFRFSLFFI